MKHANQYSDITPCFKWRTFNSSYISGTETDRQWKRETDWIVINFIIINSFYIALFSALEQTHCARRMWSWRILFTARIFNIHGSGRCTGSALWLLHGWCHVKCCRLGASFVYIIQPCTSLQCHHWKPQPQPHVCLAAVTCHLHIW